MWTNSEDFHNNLIPYQFVDMASLCTNNNRPFDDYVDFYPGSSFVGVSDFAREAEILAHLRVRAEEPTRPYTLKLSMCCLTDHTQYRAYWIIEWKE